jgi:hypothetical protein
MQKIQKLSSVRYRHVSVLSTLIKKEIKFSSYIRKFRVEQLQIHK